jgi:hypothetical protein
VSQEPEPELVFERHFTREEANSMLPQIEGALIALREAKDQLTDEEAHEALTEAAPTNGGGDHGRTVGEGFLAVRRLLGGLQEAGIVVRDVDRGLIDFPAIIDGREVYLCWEIGEEGVDHWHDLEDGFNGRTAFD